MAKIDSAIPSPPRIDTRPPVAQEKSPDLALPGPGGASAPADQFERWSAPSLFIGGIGVFAGPSPVVVANAQRAGASPVDRALQEVTTHNLTPEAAVAEWQSLTSAEQHQLVAALVEKHPAEAAEFANQLGQAGDPTAAKGFWAAAGTWMTETVADTGYHGRLAEARAFMDEVALLEGPAAKKTKGQASKMAADIPFSEPFAELSKRADRSGIAKADLERAHLHLDNFRFALLSGEKADIKAMARQRPDDFVRHLDSLKGDKAAYDAAFDAALGQPSVEFTGKGSRAGRVTDTYMENLLHALQQHGSATVKADFALRAHDGGSLRPGWDDTKAMRRDLMADPKVLSILLHQKADKFSLVMREMIQKDPAQAQSIIGAGVAGATLAYHEAMSKKPADTKAATAAAYDLGLLLGEVKEATKEAFASKPAAEAYNFLEGVFNFVSKQLVDLGPGGDLLGEAAKEVLGELAGHFTKEATKFKEDASGQKLDAALEKFVGNMFAATRESFWTLRDPGDLRSTVKESPKLDAVESEYREFNKQVDAGYAAGRDGDNNAARSR